MKSITRYMKYFSGIGIAILLIVSSGCGNMMDGYSEGDGPGSNGAGSNGTTQTTTPGVPSAPTGTITINNNAIYTFQQNITIQNSITDATEMRFSNDGTSWSTWQPYTGTTQWALTQSHGNATVHGQYRDENGTVFETSDTIIPKLEEKIIASDGVAGDFFGGYQADAVRGNRLSLSADGTILVVGVPFSNSMTGKAYVYRWNGTTWEEQILSSSDGASGDVFGMSVAISGDGSTILVGAYFDDFNAGSAYLFKWNGSSYGVWNAATSHYDENHKFRNSIQAGPNDEFGLSVALSHDGTTAVIGAQQWNSRV